MHSGHWAASKHIVQEPYASAAGDVVPGGRVHIEGHVNVMCWEVCGQGCPCMSDIFVRLLGGWHVQGLHVVRFCTGMHTAGWHYVLRHAGHCLAA